MTIVNRKEKNLSVRTANVTVQAIKIDNKQMTLSVFRQLPTSKIINYGELTICEEFNLWGKVRCIAKTENKSEHDLWIICEKDGILYRTEYPETEGLGRSGLEEENLIEAIKRLKPNLIRVADNSKYKSFSINDPRKFNSYHRDLVVFSHTNHDSNNNNLDYDDDVISYPINELEKQLDKFLEILQSEYKMALVLRKRELEIKDKLESLPQLFIAV